MGSAFGVSGGVISLARLTGVGQSSWASKGLKGTPMGGRGKWESRERPSAVVILPQLMVLSANPEAFVTSEGLDLWERPPGVVGVSG